MEQHLIPETPAQKEVGRDRSKADARQESADKGRRKKAFILAIFGALELVALVFWMLAVDVFPSDKSWIVHVLFLSLAGSSFLLGGAHLLSGVCKKTRHRFWVWVISSVVCLVFSFAVIKFTKPNERTADSGFGGKTPDDPRLKASPSGGPVGWEPPELRDGTTWVSVNFGWDRLGISVDALKKRPEWVDRNTDPYTLFVASNRVYLNVEWQNNKKRILRMDGDFADRLLDRGWDNNSSSNAFEIVKEHEGRNVPMLQVIYVKPNEITLNGVFVRTNRDAWVRFPTAAQTFRTSNGVIPWERITQKPLFKYPSWRYPGQLAD